MKKSLLHATFAALLLAGCAQNEITDISPDAAPPVGFKVFTDAQTRGLVTNGSATSANVTTGIQTTGFGVFAYYTGQSTWSALGASTTPNFMYNQEVKYNSGWEYTPVKYWPNTEGDKISFFAYAPYNKANTGISFTTTTKATTGAPKLNFALQDKPQNMVDLVATNATQNTASDKTIDVQKKTTNVTFLLKHVLTRASFKAKLDAALTGTSATTHVFVTGMRILGTNARTDAANSGNSVTANPSSKFYSAATYQWSDGKWNYTSPTPTLRAEFYNLGETDFMPLTSKSGTVSGYTTNAIELLQNGNTIDLQKANQYLFLIPPYDNEGIKAATDVRMQLDYDIVTVDASLSKGYSITSTTATVSLPIGTLKRETAYIFTFTVGLEKVQVSATVENWATEESVYIPSTSATNAAGITTGIGTMNTAKGQNKNCNYFVITCSGGSYGSMNLSSAAVTNFVSGDKIELNFKDAPGVTGVTLPTGWKTSASSLSAIGKIILEKN